MASKNICDDGHEGTTITRICILKSRPRCRPCCLSSLMSRELFSELVPATFYNLDNRVRFFAGE